MYVCILARGIIVNYSLIFIIPRVLITNANQACIFQGMELSLGGSLNITKTKTKGVNLLLNQIIKLDIA